MALPQLKSIALRASAVMCGIVALACFGHMTLVIGCLPQWGVYCCCLMYAC